WQRQRESGQFLEIRDSDLFGPDEGIEKVSCHPGILLHQAVADADGVHQRIGADFPVISLLGRAVVGEQPVHIGGAAREKRGRRAENTASSSPSASMPASVLPAGMVLISTFVAFSLPPCGGGEAGRADCSSGPSRQCR